MNQIPEVVKTDDLFYVCSLIEYIGREQKLRRADVVASLGEETIRRIYRYADTFHCEQIAKVADDFIARRVTFRRVACIQGGGNQKI